MEPLTQEMVRFIDQHIDSVDQLEILRIMAAQRSPTWSRDSLARVLQAQPQIIALHLAALERRGLLTTVSDQTYQFGPHADDIVEHVNRLLLFYNERPVTVIRAVYSKPRSNKADP